MGFIKDRWVRETIEGTVQDARIGALTANVNPERLDAWCSWQGQHVIAGHTRATRVRLSGDSRGPYAGLLAQTHRVLDALGAIGDKADARLRDHGDSGSFRDFYLSAIFDWDQHDEILELEFRPLDPSCISMNSDRMLCWPDDDELMNHHVVLRAERRAREA
ncbi:MAG: hypothetical protein M3680_01170 [Myxococcota bacterium]|nr:hypothetical protein [Myxococcota bacterium]